MGGEAGREIGEVLELNPKAASITPTASVTPVAATNPIPPDDQPVSTPIASKTMSNTMKAAWLGGAFALLATIIAGLFAVMGTPSITIKDSGCANVNIGTSSGTTKQDCGDKDDK